jgi:hypothetical protein
VTPKTHWLAEYRDASHIGLSSMATKNVMVDINTAVEQP